MRAAEAMGPRRGGRSESLSASRRARFRSKDALRDVLRCPHLKKGRKEWPRGVEQERGLCACVLREWLCCFCFLCPHYGALCVVCALFTFVLGLYWVQVGCIGDVVCGDRPAGLYLEARVVKLLSFSA